MSEEWTAASTAACLEIPGLWGDLVEAVLVLTFDGTKPMPVATEEGGEGEAFGAGILYPMHVQNWMRQQEERLR